MTWLRITMKKERTEETPILDQFIDFIGTHYEDDTSSYLLYDFDYGLYSTRKMTFSIVNINEKIVWLFYSKTHSLSTEEDQRMRALQKEKGRDEVQRLENQLCKETTEREYIQPLFKYLKHEKITAHLARIDWSVKA